MALSRPCLKAMPPFKAKFLALLPKVAFYSLRPLVKLVSTLMGKSTGISQFWLVVSA